MGIAQELANNFSGPIIFDYVWWVLRKAKERGIKRLYFLARDGYTLLRVARVLCNRFNLDIECRYLYCSRMALRMPTYFFLGDEAFDLLLMWGYKVTLRSVLLRADLNENERKEVYLECGLTALVENTPLSKHEFDAYAEKLRQSKVLRRFLREKSKLAYDAAIGYFHQEGLFDQDILAFVDSGWTGSIQRSFRQLLEFAGYSGKLVGFYFGMNECPKTIADGEYLTWYFNVNTRAAIRAPFCNNLFECLLSAPHGMTKGYQKDGIKYAPCLTPPSGKKTEAMIEEQSWEICVYCKKQAERIIFLDFVAGILHKDTYCRVKKYMFDPPIEAVDYYSAFMFCDDVTEMYHLQLASRQQIDLLSDSFVVKRVIQKMAHKTPVNGVSGMLWAYGTIAFLPRKRWWYRWNVFLWEWLKCVSKKGHHSVKAKLSLEDWCRFVDTYETVSFDVFDTLVYRTVNKPTDVFLLMEPWVETNYGIYDFQQKRIRAEYEARQSTHQEEITLPDIYNAMGVSGERAESLMAYERQTELSVIRRDGLMGSLYEYCVERGKHVLIVTDMYQSKEFIIKALQRLGINRYSAIYVSSNEGVTKASGNLYREIEKTESSISKKSWLHIGDNMNSDMIVPKMNGIRTALYNNGRNINGHSLTTIEKILFSLKAFWLTVK